VFIWVFDLAHHLHAQYRLNMIRKSDLKSDSNEWTHHIEYMEQKDVHKSLHVAPEMHALESMHVAPKMLVLLMAFQLALSCQYPACILQNIPLS
jgi:hypothetical protein